MGASTSFQTELEQLINRHNREMQSDTPDFILAAFMLGALKAFEKSIRDRDGFYGFTTRPGQVRPTVMNIEPLEPNKPGKMSPESLAGHISTNLLNKSLAVQEIRGLTLVVQYAARYAETGKAADAALLFDAVTALLGICAE